MLKKVGFLLISPLIILLIVELALRGYFHFFGTEIDRIMYVYSAEQIVDRNPAFIGLPFVGHGSSPRHPEHNQLGYRNREITLEKPDDVYRIITIGGSTTYGAGVAVDETWSAQLEAILHDTYELEFIEIINTASVGYTTWHSLSNLAFRVLDLQPDLLIIYHGTNDAKARLTHPDCYTGQTAIRGLYDGMWNPAGPDLSPFTIYRYVGIGRGWLPNPIDLNSWVLSVESSDPTCPDATSLSYTELFQANPPIYFERNLRNIVYLAQAHHVDVMLSTWAYHPEMAEQEFIPAFEDQNQIILELARELDVYAYDLMSSLPANETLWFFDGEHQNASGSLMQAEHYAAFIAETIQPSIVGN